MESDRPKLPKYVFLRGRMLWVNLRIYADKWQIQPSGFSIEQDPDGSKAARHRAMVQEQLDASGDFEKKTGKTDTVKAYGEALIPRRKKLGVRSWEDDESRLKHHVYDAVVSPTPPATLGEMFVRDVRARHINTMIQAVRAKGRAPKTVWNVYGIVQALFRAAEIDGLVDKSPCVLTEHELGKLTDKDPTGGAAPSTPRRSICSS
jgi:hypothetical protein